MAFTNWDFFSYNLTAPSFGINTSSPLVGAGSLRAQGTPINPTDGAWCATLDNTFSRGFDVGRIRTVFRKRAATGGGASFIVFFLANQFDVTSTGTCYFLKMTHESTGFSLMKSTGTGILSGSLLASYGNGVNGLVYTTSPTGPCVVDVSWFGGPDAVSIFGGTRILVRCNQGITNFNAMAKLADFVDTSSPITTGTAEGIGGVSTDTAFPIDDYIDDTGVFERTITP